MSPINPTMHTSPDFPHKSSAKISNDRAISRGSTEELYGDDSTNHGLRKLAKLNSRLNAKRR